MRAHDDLREAWRQTRDAALRDAFARRYRELVGVPVEAAKTISAAIEEQNAGASMESIMSSLGND